MGIHLKATPYIDKHHQFLISIPQAHCSCIIKVDDLVGEVYMVDLSRVGDCLVRLALVLPPPTCHQETTVHRIHPTVSTSKLGWCPVKVDKGFPLLIQTISIINLAGPTSWLDQASGWWANISFARPCSISYPSLLGQYPPIFQPERRCGKIGWAQKCWSGGQKNSNDSAWLCFVELRLNWPEFSFLYLVCILYSLKYALLAVAPECS